MSMTPEERRAKERARDRRRYQRLKADPERYAAHLEYMREYNRAYRAAKKAKEAGAWQRHQSERESMRASGSGRTGTSATGRGA